MDKKIVLIQNTLLIELKDKLKTHNEELVKSNSGKKNKEKKSKLKLDVLVLFVSLVNSIPCSFRGNSLKSDGIVTLNATRMKKAYHDKYYDYMNFLLKHNFLEKVSGSSARAHKSCEYRISDKYCLDKLKTHEIIDKTLLKRMSNNVYLDEILEKKAFCEHKRPHLVKWFNEYLFINKNDAYKEITSLIKSNTFYEYSNVLHSIQNFSNQEYTYSIDPTTDNRLHTTLTRTPKKIRKHITYNGDNIVGLDVKTSQVYFFCVILKAILMKDEALLEKINATTVLDDKLVFKLMNLKIDSEEVKGFVMGVLDSEVDFYESFSKKLDITYNKEGLPTRQESNFKSKDKNKLKKSTFEAFSIVPYKNERALTKRAIMDIFYSSHDTTISEAVVFRKEYPSVSKIIKCIKVYGVKFWRLLDHVEAYCLLDYAAFKFAKNHPNIFITSIHDCLVTTESNIMLLKEEIERYLIEVTTIKTPPKFEIETWS